MEEIIRELVQTVSKEIDAFNRLLSTLRNKQKAIVEGELEKLKNHVDDENKLITETKGLEADRISTTQALAEELSLSSATPKLTDIIDNVESKYAERLREQRDLLKSILGEIRDLNDNNQFLINYSLSFIENNMRMIMTGKEELPVYRKDGSKHPSVENPRMLDQTL